MEFSQSITNFLILIGAIIMAFNIKKFKDVKRLLKEIATHHYITLKPILLFHHFLIISFFIGYIIVLFALNSTRLSVGNFFISVIFVSGAIFVLLSIILQKRMIVSIEKAFKETVVANKKLFNNQKKLTETQEELNSIFRSAPTGIGLVRDRIIQQVNDRICEMTGYSKNELVGQNERIFYPTNEDYEYVGKEKYRQIQEKGTGTVETLFKHKNGKIFNILMSSTPLDPINISAGVTFTALDVTERKIAEETLRKSEERYRLLADNITDNIWVLDFETIKFSYVSPSVINLNGYSADEALGLDLNDILTPSSLEKVNNLLSEELSNQLKNPDQTTSRILELEQIHKDGTTFWTEVSVRFIYDDKNRAISILGVTRNVNERKQLQAQLEQSQKMESIGTLTGGIAHDFNNLLYMIVGNTELALEDIPKWNPAYTNLEEIKSASLRAAGIVKQLLTFSRKTDQKLIPIDAVTVIKDSLKLLRSTIPSTVKIHEQFPDDDIIILADSTQINQIMMNLCINASQAMEETGGTLKINIEKTICEAEDVKELSDLVPGNFLKITVSDTGTGISPEIINQIYDPYFTTKEMGEGSGMGLSIVLGIIKNHGGAIWVDSSIGKGTAFILLFPMVDEIPVNKIETDDDYPSGTETILFVDDEQAITDMNQKVLEKLGYRVEARVNPVEALALFKLKPDTFDLIITDMTMPQMTGSKLAQKLKEIRPDIPVIICTGHSSLIDEEKAKQLGIDGYVMKPASMSTISKAIRKVLDK